MSSWKAAESRVGAWLGAKGIGNSGRLPLSGGNSGITRSDHPHPTIFNECKRDKSYLSAGYYWIECNGNNKKLKPHLRIPTIVALPKVVNNKVVEKTSDIWCFHNDDIEKIVDHLNGIGDVNMFDWKGARPAILTLYNKTYNIWKNSRLEADRNMKVASVTFINHGNIGFWIVINKNDIKLFWKLVLEARIGRNDLIMSEKCRLVNPNYEEDDLWLADAIEKQH